MKLSSWKALLKLGLSLALCSCGSGKSATAPVAVAPTLSSIQQQIFTPGCALPSCHSSAARRGGLVLEAGHAYAQLVNIPAENDSAKAARKLRVVPGHPEQSFLIDKLSSLKAGEGSLMPYTGNLLPASQIEAIRTWIQRGASAD